MVGLLPTSGENVMSIAPLEIYLLRKMVTLSNLILPAVQKHTDIYKTFFFLQILQTELTTFFMSVINNGLIHKSTVMIIVLSAQQIWTQPADVSSGDLFL